MSLFDRLIMNLRRDNKETARAEPQNQFAVAIAAANDDGAVMTFNNKAITFSGD